MVDRIRQRSLLPLLGLTPIESFQQLEAEGERARPLLPTMATLPSRVPQPKLPTRADMPLGKAALANIARDVSAPLPKDPTILQRLQADKPFAAGLQAAGQALSQASGYTELPKDPLSMINQAMAAFNQAQQKRAIAEANMAMEQKQLEAETQKQTFDRIMAEKEFALKQRKQAFEEGKTTVPKLEEFYDEETGTAVKGYYSPENPQANKFGYVVVGGAKAQAPTKREVRTVAGVGLVDITDPESPKVIFQSEKEQSRDLRSVAGVGVVDFSNPDAPKVLYEAKQNETRRFQNIGAYMLDGEYIGEGTFDTKTNKRFIRDDQGNEIPIPFNAIPVTEGLMGKGIYTAAQMSAESDKVVELEKGLRQYTNYLGNLDKAEVGINRLADQMTTWMKTFISTKAKQANLTEEELALAVADGQLQGLLGASRIDTVGGGVMTEQDALRVIKNLGGNVSMLQNPAVVREQISRLFYEKYKSYENSLAKYNAQVNSFYKNMGYKSKDPLKVNVDLLSPDMVAKLGLASPTPEVTPDVSDITYTEEELNNALDKYN